MAFIEASLEELPVRANLDQSYLATTISAPGSSLLGGSATLTAVGVKISQDNTRKGPLAGDHLPQAVATNERHQLLAGRAHPDHLATSTM